MTTIIRPARADDAEAVSDVIVSALRHSNARDYPPEVIARVERSFTPQAVGRLMSGRTMVVAEQNGIIVGTASLEGTVVRTVFVAPAYQGQGIGTALMAEIERLARLRDVDTLRVPSSLTARAFYERLGFVAQREVRDGDEVTIVMARSLAGTQA